MARQKLCIAGGTGFVGRCVRQWFAARGWDVVTLSRRGGEVQWDSRAIGPWAEAVRSCDVLLNLAGRSVNCRYTPGNRREIFASRLESTRVLSEVLGQDAGRVKTWLNASTATIYRHAEDRPQDEETGEITRNGTSDDANPTRAARGWQETWAFSIDVATQWEQAFFEQPVPQVRQVALRMAIVMGRGSGGAFSLLNRLARFGLGGTIRPGMQRVSFIHERDLCRAIEFIIEHDTLAGPVNLVAPDVPTMEQLWPPSAECVTSRSACRRRCGRCTSARSSCEPSRN
jgi:NAD dependent epimerase/dehydratase family enzyme